MSTPQSVSPAPVSSGDASSSVGRLRPFLPLLLLLFAGSGCAALIYEIVWLQLLQLAVGSSAVSLGVLLGTYMGGMCLASLLLSRLLPPLWNPLRVYLVPLALRAVAKGGTVVCGGIHMSDIPSFPYDLLWEERVLCS